MRCLCLTIPLLALCLPVHAQPPDAPSLSTPVFGVPRTGPPTDATPTSAQPPLAPLMRVYTGPPTWTTVPVDVTDADVSPELVPAVMRAMSAGIDRQRLLALLFKEANKNGRTFVLFWGVHGGDGFPDWKGARTGGTTTQTFRVPVRNSLPPPGKALAVRPFYSLRQTLHVSAHILDMTVIKNEAFLRVTLTETPLPATAPPPAGWTGLTVTQTLSFHDGETQLLSATTRADGAHHLVFVTAHIVPPFGAADRKKGITLP